MSGVGWGGWGGVGWGGVGWGGGGLEVREGLSVTVHSGY